MSDDAAIIKIDAATRMLAEARDLADILEIRDRAVAMRAYATAKKSGEAANIAKVIQARAERKAGEFLAGMERAQGKRTDIVADCNDVDKPPTYAEMGIEKTAAHRWQAIAELPEEVFEEHIAQATSNGGELTTGALYKLAQKRRQEKEREQTQANELDIALDDTYRAIVIDPPWPIQKILRDTVPTQDVFDYPTMTLEEIGRLPVADLANDAGCHLYLWVTQKYLPAGLKFVEDWGFNYQCLMTWLKPSGFTPFSWMYNTEHVIFARRGNLQLERMGLKLGFTAPTNGHSVKPDAFYQRVLEASPLPRLELFARQPRDGFVVWGNEV